MKIARRLACCLILMVATLCPAQQMVITPLKKTGVYDLNEKVSWQIDFHAENPADLRDITYSLKKNGRTVFKEGALDFTEGRATVETSLNEGAAILLDIRRKQGNKTLAGAFVAPQKIEPSSPRPDDFDEFWAAKIAQLAKIPANPQLESSDGGKPGVDYFKIRMDNINDSHIYGQLAKPKAEGKYPALLILQWAGIYGLPKSNVVDRAEQGWLTLNIMPHDLPFDEPPAFYTEKQKTLGNYYTLGNEDRETSYFLRMYLSAYRAAEYLTRRPDWDGKTLVVMGTSMGGQQTLVIAGLHLKVTAMLANVPASCDVTGPKIGRAGPFPSWHDQVRQKQNEKIYEVARYFDAANFASHIKCPALVAMGLIDETCPPASIYTAFNQIKSLKEVVVMVDSDHQGKNNTQAPYYTRAEQWLSRLVKGESAIGSR